jgi:hypothetical protein
MRFEVLKRDAEIDCWRRVADGADAIAERARLETRWHEIDADFAFVAACNEGGEAMAPEQSSASGRSPQERGCVPSTIASVCRATNASARSTLRCCPCQFVSLCSPIGRSI